MIVDETMQSLLNYGSPDFPFAYFLDGSDQLAKNCISWHWHNSLEFSYVSAGHLVCEISGKQICLDQGDAVFINSGVLHCFTLQESSVLENILFEPEFIAPKESRIYLTSVLPYLNSDFQYHVFRTQNKSDQMILSQIRTCCMTAHQTHPGDSKHYMDIFTNVLTLWNTLISRKDLCRNGKLTNMISLTESRTRKMLYYIYTHYSEKTGLAEIAESADISPREALRCFSESIHSSPVRYLNEYRLKCAEQLLRNSMKSISDIALETGHDNAGYFCKTFKKRYVISPLQYRKTHNVNYLSRSTTLHQTGLS